MAIPQGEKEGRTCNTAATEGTCEMKSGATEMGRNVRMGKAREKREKGAEKGEEDAGSSPLACPLYSPAFVASLHGRQLKRTGCS